MSMEMSRKGRVDQAPQAQLSLSHVTPWGSPIDEENSPNRASEPTARSNHQQNHETKDTDGDYSVPDLSEAHNHFQNKETDQIDGKLKLSSSKINDGHGVFDGDVAAYNISAGGSIKLKMQEGTSRINSGNDIFGPPVDTDASSSRQRKPREEPFQERCISGHIRPTWTG